MAMLKRSQQKLYSHDSHSELDLKLGFYSAILRRVRLCDSMSSVYLSVCLSMTFRYRDHIGWDA